MQREETGREGDRPGGREVEVEEDEEVEELNRKEVEMLFAGIERVLAER